MDVTYRELEKGDAESLINLRLSVIKSNPYSFSITEEEELKIGKGNIEEAVESYRASNERQMLGAFSDELVGVVGVERYGNKIEKHKMRLWGPYVDSSNRGKGIGNTLIARVLDYGASVDGVEIITLETISESKDAISLFMKHSFENTGTQYKALCFDGKYFDLFYMQRNIST